MQLKVGNSVYFYMNDLYGRRIWTMRTIERLTAKKAYLKNSSTIVDREPKGTEKFQAGDMEFEATRHKADSGNYAFYGDPQLLQIIELDQKIGIIVNEYRAFQTSVRPLYDFTTEQINTLYDTAMAIRKWTGK